MNKKILLADKLMPSCIPQCLNNGLCQFDTNSQQYVCICTPDYNGLYCETESQSPLVNCDDTTCRNGGFCTGTIHAPVCNCPSHTHGKMCERRDLIYTIEVSSSKNESIENTIINANMNQLESILSYVDIICRFIKSSIQSGKYIWLSNSLTNCKFDSVDLEQKLNKFELRFDLLENISLNLTSKIIAEQIESGFKKVNLNEIEYKVITTYIFSNTNSTLFTINPRNPCEYGYHDCSNYAKCTYYERSNYACACGAFTIDTSRDSRFRGRQCLFDGLIIFTFTIVGLLISALSIVVCGCQKTIWRRFRKQPETIDLINMPKTYEI